MMKSIASLVLILPFLVPVTVMWLWMKNRERLSKKAGIKHPLASSDLLRPAGYSISNALEEKRWDLIEGMMNGAVASMIAMVIYIGLSQTSLVGTKGAFVVAVIAAISMLVNPIRKLLSALPKLRDLRLGMEGEMATAEELNKLMLKGFRVYHDMPADGFNIDHVVIGPTGIFAVETKTRTKRKVDGADGHYKAVFERGSLRLAGRSEDKSLDQARRQAQWLSRWLAKSVGEPVRVRPCLALPGWYVDLKAKPDVVIFSPRQADSIFPLMRDSDRLDAILIQRISFQVEKTCRDIKPRTALL